MKPNYRLNVRVLPINTTLLVEMITKFVSDITDEKTVIVTADSLNLPQSSRFLLPPSTRNHLSVYLFAIKHIRSDVPLRRVLKVGFA